MSTSTFVQHQITQQKSVKSYQPKFVFVLQLFSGEYVVGSASNVGKRVASLNSGFNPAIKQSLQVARIVGVKELTQDRNLISVAKKFIDKYGSDAVIVV